MAGIGKYKGEGSFKMPGFGTKAGLDTALNKKGGYHKGQVNDAETEEMNDNIATGKGPAKPKNVVSARPKQTDVDEPTLRAADGSTSTAPTFSDLIDNEKNQQKDPKTKKAKKINKKLLG
jgi:hypothetical protein